MNTNPSATVTPRVNLSQLEFYKLCRTLEKDQDIQQSRLDIDQVVARYATTAIPGRVLKRASIRKALRASEMIHKVKPTSGRSGNVQGLLWARLRNVETVVRRIATQLGVDHSELDLVISQKSLADSNGQQQ